MAAPGRGWVGVAASGSTAFFLARRASHMAEQPVTDLSGGLPAVIVMEDQMKIIWEEERGFVEAGDLAEPSFDLSAAGDWIVGGVEDERGQGEVAGGGFAVHHERVHFAQEAQ